MHKNHSLLWILITAISSLFLLGQAPAARADLTAQEMDLAAGGEPWEANLDGQGMLWVSHTSPAEIWRIDTQGGGVTVYPVGGAPSDGRGDGAGALWWADLGGNRLSRLNTADNRVDAWEIPGSSGLYTTAIDDDGLVWAMDYSKPLVYRLDPAENWLCAYPLPDEGLGNYLEADGQYLWLGDYVNHRIVRLDRDPLAGSLKWWQLPSSSNPLDLAMDGKNNLWWTDTSLNTLGWLDPAQDRFTSFQLPGNLDPQMLGIAGDQVWFSFQDPDSPAGGVGRLEPPSVFADEPVTSASPAVSPACGPLAPSDRPALTTSTPQAGPTEQSYPVTYSQGGWLTFQLPENGSPFGIAAGQAIWLVDQGRGKLARLPYPARVTACAVRDADGNLDTTVDRSPRMGWPLFLTIAGVRQFPAQETGSDGCAAWSGLQPGLTYGASEDVPAGWIALTPPDHEFGAAWPNQAYSHTFILEQRLFTFLPAIFR